MINLLYPASFLPHKNHSLLCDFQLEDFCLSNNIRILLTIDSVPSCNSFKHIQFIGRQKRSSILEILSESYALIFLSSFESLGLPLIEAANRRIPVICPNLPYANELLGSSPYYINQLTTVAVTSTLHSFCEDLPHPRRSKLCIPLIPIDVAWDRFINA